VVELVLDIHLELDPVALAQEPDPTRAIAELSRQAAEVQCLERSAQLRYPDLRDVEVRRALQPVTGDEVLLVASRWVADGPTTT
jgi:hypothetical protein